MDADDRRRGLQDGVEREDVLVDLPVIEHVAVNLRERRVAHREAPEQDHELEQVRVRHLPERLLRLAEEIVEQRGDGVGHRVGVQVVLERVVADTRIEADLHVVVGATRALQHAPHLAAEVALHLEHEPGDLAVLVLALPPEELIDVGIHARGGLAGAHGAEHHDAGVEAPLRNREPLRVSRSAGQHLVMDLPQDERRLGPRFG